MQACMWLPGVIPNNWKWFKDIYKSLYKPLIKEIMWNHCNLVCILESGHSKYQKLMIFIFYTVSAEKPRYAESWDFEVSGSSFLQFELSMGCSKSTSFSHGVRLEYSTDCGHHWSLITPECVPPAIGCAGYTQSSIYTSTQYKHWRRITVYLPSAAKYVF